MHTPPHILVVEDEESICSALAFMLEKEKFYVSQAVNGEEGLLIAKEDVPDLILLDLMMPRMDGIAMLKALRAEDWGKDVKVMVLTNSDESEKVAEALENGAFDFLVKSDWKLRDVLAKVQAVLT